VDSQNIQNSYYLIFSFTNQNGEIVNQKTVDGKIYVANFIFTSCGSICQKMTDNMKILQDKFIDDSEILLLSHSPEKKITLLF
jgi:protein SCO1/2